MASDENPDQPGELGRGEVSLRELHSQRDYEECVELQRHTWGESFDEVVPGAVIKISQKVGGVAAGAFDASGRQVGFVWGLTGVRDGRLTHWSHMLAVHESARGLGLGKRLKYFQRSLLVPLGVEQMLWTYDPLVARNATLNLERLGAVPVHYVRDMYGEGTGSELHSGLGTDRFVVAWDLKAPVAPCEEPTLDRPRRIAESGGLEIDIASELAAARVLNRAAGEERARIPEPSDLPRPATGDERPWWVEIPGDVEALKRRDRGHALVYRDSLRAVFPELLSRGFLVDGVLWVDEQRSWYRVRAASRS